MTQPVTPNISLLLFQDDRPVNKLRLTNPQGVRTHPLVHSAAMDTIVQEAGTVARVHLQGRVVVGLGMRGLWGLEHNPQEGVGKDLLPVD